MARLDRAPRLTPAEQIATVVAESVNGVVDAYAAYRCSGGAEEARVLFDRLAVLTSVWPPRSRGCDAEPMTTEER